MPRAGAELASQVLSPEKLELLSPDQLQKLESLLEIQRANPRNFPDVLCWSTDTDPEMADVFNAALYGPEGTEYVLDAWWYRTATDGPGREKGQPVTLTWGLLPNGVLIPFDDDSLPSAIVSRLDNAYGSGPGGEDLTQRPWFPLVKQAMEEWSNVSGVNYVYEPNDDGAPFPGSEGVLGVRPDIRLGGRYIDGSGPGYNLYGVNNYPDGGDMILDTSNIILLSDPEYNSRRLRNLITHENGHGLGMGHACGDSTIMDHIIQFRIDGVQHDDIRGINEGYGDVYEFPGSNNTVNLAANLGSLADRDTLRLHNLSIHEGPDRDFLAFTVPERTRITLNLAPVGRVSYEDIPTPDGSCYLGYLFNSKSQNNLGMFLLGTSGSNMLTGADANPSGFPESIDSFLLEEGAGTYFVKVFGDTNRIQLYDLDVIVSLGEPPVAICKNVTSCRSQVNSDRFNNGSYDPDGDPLTISVSPQGPYPPGMTQVEVVLFDGALFDTCQATVSVNQAPAAVARDVMVEVGEPSCMGTVVPDSADGGSSDPDGDALTLTLEPSGPFGEGMNPVLLIATDPCGASDTAAATVTVNCTVPVTLLSFAALREGDVTVVTWEVARVWDHAGFHVYREANDDRVRLTQGLLTGQTRYRYEDRDAPEGPARYWLEEVSRSGESSWHGPVTVETAVTVLSLSRARPNPFTGTTQLRYAVPGPVAVDLGVFDIRGRRVKTLVRGTPGAGTYDATWTGDTDGGAQAPAGVYFIRFRGGGETRLQKVVRVF
jgi:hypothetical protein